MFQLLAGSREFCSKFFFVQHHIPDAGERHRCSKERHQAHESFPVDEVGARVRMMRESIREVPADAAHHRHGDPFFPSPIPGSKGDRYEIKDEKAKLITCDVIKPA